MKKGIPNSTLLISCHHTNLLICSFIQEKDKTCSFATRCCSQVGCGSLQPVAQGDFGTLGMRYCPKWSVQGEAPCRERKQPSSGPQVTVESVVTYGLVLPSSVPNACCSRVCFSLVLLCCVKEKRGSGRALDGSSDIQMRVFITLQERSIFELSGPGVYLKGE